MSKNLSMITKNIGRKLKKHSPEILTGIGIAGMISATVMGESNSQSFTKY